MSELVSVCLPVFNREEYVYNAVASVLDQCYTNIELIIVDDGSTDKTVEIVEGIDDSRIKLVVHEQNRGIIVSRKTALDHASGKFIAIFDSDDICLPGRISKQVSVLNQGYDFCGGWSARFSAQSPVAGLSTFEHIWPTPQTKEDAFAYLFKGSPVVNPSVMFSREFLDRTGEFYSQDDYPAADYALWAKLLTSNDCKFMNIQLPLVAYRLHDKRASSLHSKAQTDKANSIRCSLFETFGAPAEHPGIALHNNFYSTTRIREPLSEIHWEHVRSLYAIVLKSVLEQGSQNLLHLKRTFETTLGQMASSPKTENYFPETEADIYSCDVSFVVPAFNVQRFIGQCLDSIRNQSADDFEVIIVNDGSTDETERVIKVYLDDDRFSLLNQSNQGLSVARNTGIRAAGGRYIALIDGDDYIDPDFVETIAAVKDNPDVIVFGHNAVDEYTGHIEPRFEPYESIDKANIFKNHVSRKYGYSACNKVYKNELLRVTPFYPSLIHEDELFGIELFASAQTVTVINYVGYFYRQRFGSITKMNSLKNIEGFTQIESMLDNIFIKYKLRHRFPKECSVLRDYLTRGAMTKLNSAQESGSLPRIEFTLISFLYKALEGKKAGRLISGGSAKSLDTGLHVDASRQIVKKSASAPFQAGYFFSSHRIMALAMSLRERHPRIYFALLPLVKPIYGLLKKIR